MKLWVKELEVRSVGTKGVSQNHLLSFDDNKVLKIINNIAADVVPFQMEWI